MQPVSITAFKCQKTPKKKKKGKGKRRPSKVYIDTGVSFDEKERKTEKVKCLRRFIASSINHTSFRWKMPAARAAEAFVCVKTWEKCSTAPAPLLAITGMLTASEINFTRSISNPFP